MTDIKKCFAGNLIQGNLQINTKAQDCRSQMREWKLDKYFKPVPQQVIQS